MELGSTPYALDWHPGQKKTITVGCRDGMLATLRVKYGLSVQRWNLCLGLWRCDHEGTAADERFRDYSGPLEQQQGVYFSGRMCRHSYSHVCLLQVGRLAVGHSNGAVTLFDSASGKVRFTTQYHNP